MAGISHTIDFILRVRDKVTGKLKQVSKVTNSINKAGQKVVSTWTKVNGKFRITAQRIEHLNRAAKRGAMRFFGLGMGMLFMGMATNRAIMGFISSSIEAYKIAGNEQSIFNVKTQELSAAWEFFKFSLIDALSQSELFVALIDWVIQLINRFNELSPAKKFILAIVIALAAVGTAAMVAAGQIGLFMIGIEMVQQGAIKAVAKALWAVNAALFANPVVWVMLAVISLIILVGWLVKTFDDAFSALKFFGGFGLWVLALIGEAIINAVLFPLRGMLKILDMIIAALNIIFGTNWGSLYEKLPAWMKPGALLAKTESYLAKAEWFREPREDVEKGETFGEFSSRIASEISERIASGVYEGMNKALEEHQPIVGTPDT